MHKPTDSVRVVIFNTTVPGSFLIVTETDDPDNWKLPGGKFEMGADGIESPLDAASRELTEEVGLMADEVQLEAVETLVNDDGASARYIFKAEATPEQIRPSDEIAKTAWVTEEALPECKNRGHILSAVATARGN